MRELAPAIVAVTSYIGLLFVLAIWVERRAARGRNLADNALVYALAQAVYCTTWTYYGSVGFAVSSGVLFLTVYLGPTLAFVFAGSVLRKLVRIKASHGITSIADFMSARYGKSQAVGALATIIIVIGLVPYLSLQLKTMMHTVAIITEPSPGASAPVGRVIGPIMVILMVVFTIVFGIRRLRPTERHPGMMVALVAECVVKLAAFLIAGTFVTYVLFDGMGDLLDRARALPTNFVGAGRGVLPPPSTWASHLLLSAAAILFLPRQFHVAVVENSSEDHVRTARWLLPLYFLAICVFVLPIATAGIATGLSRADADTFVLDLPVRTGHAWLSWLIFLGGFSAGTGMVMIETVTIATMVSNHLVLPVLDAIPRLRRLVGWLRPLRWAAATLIISAAFAYERLFGWRYGIVETGLISFAAALQFAPAMLAGLYWKQASKAGALAGLGAGFVVWAYTLIVPLLSRQGFLPADLLADGPFGVGWLRPNALFGTGGLDSLTHATLWTMVFNVGFFVAGSLLREPRAAEARVAERMVDALLPPGVPYGGVRRPALIDATDKRVQAEQLLAAYFGQRASHRLAADAFRAAGARNADRVSILQLAQVEAEVERALASSIGSAAAHAAIKRDSLIAPDEAIELGRAYAEILAELKVPPSELRRKVDYQRERARLLAQEAETMRALADASRRLAASLDYGTTADSAAHVAVPWLAPAALLFVAEPLPGTPLRHFVFAHRDPGTEQALAPRLAALPLATLPPVERAVRERAPQATAASAAIWPAPLAELGCDLSISLPLVARASTLGALTLFAGKGDRFRYPDDVALAQELAFRCAVALDNASLFHRTEEAVHARDEFLAVASHELKTPMTPLSLQVQYLHRLLLRGTLGGVSNDRLDEVLKRSESQIARLARLVDSLLDVSRITSGRLSLSRERVDLAALVAQVLAMVHDELEVAGCAPVLELQPDVVGLWDRLRIEQVLTNLLTNAIKYAPGAPVEIRASAAGGWATLTVRDHGPGIGPEDRERIFQPFERAVSYLQVSGFGLGLYIVRQIVEAHGGRVTLETEPGLGCAFSVGLPLEPRPGTVLDDELAAHPIPGFAEHGPGWGAERR